ncbi:MAG TPA: hypothetical protein PK152_07485 [Anaerolineales bacterium]|nr:hypothetical protein [Anaerolineales bacterium]HRK88960.1 hypothetical protein [Anaerolineales bacterium]
MLKKQYLLLAIFICVLLILLGSLISIPIIEDFNEKQTEHDIRVENLHKLLCEPFNAETMPEEILSKLREVGDIVIAGNDTTDPNLSIVFNDSRLNEIYGRFTVTFHDGKYVGASIPTGFEKIEVICSYR